MDLLQKIKGLPFAAVGAGLFVFVVTVTLNVLQETVHAQTDTAPDAVVDQAKAAEVLTRYCVTCHGPDMQKANVRMDSLELIDTVDLQGLFVKAREAVHFEQMPPEKAKQPSPAEREVLLTWLGAQLAGEAAGKLREKLERPESGNYVNHEDLFSGNYYDLKPFTYDRRWLISDYIFDEKFHRIFNDHGKSKIDGRIQAVGGLKEHPVKLTNPFAPDDLGGLRYYANQSMDSGQVQTMLANARLASDYMISLARQDSTYLPAISRLLAVQYESEARFEARRRFLEDHIERVLQDVFKDRHERMLPAFVPVTIPGADRDQALANKAKFHAATPGREELGVMYRTLIKHRDQATSEEDLLQAAERDWFYDGEDPAVIQRRLTFYKNYTKEFWDNASTNSKYGNYASTSKYAPLNDAEMQLIYGSVREHRKQGDTFRAVVVKCADQWRRELEHQISSQGPASEDDIRALIDQLFNTVYERTPSEDEVGTFSSLFHSYSESLGIREGIGRLIQTMMLKSEFVYRQEYGVGQADEDGRRMMSPREASYAIAYALTDSSPDAVLVQAVQEGRLNTRADYEREVRRLLAQRDRYTLIDHAVHGEENVFDLTNLPIRELRFFREFFAYPKMMPIFKDNKRFGGLYHKSAARLVAEADRLIEYVLEQDTDVFNQLLTTDSFYVFHSGDNQAMAEASERLRKINDYFKDKDWRNFTYQDMLKHKDFLAEAKLNFVNLNPNDSKERQKKSLMVFKDDLDSFSIRFESGSQSVAPYSSQPGGPGDAKTRAGIGLRGPEVAKFYNIDLLQWEYPTTQPASVEHRMGMLTHPAWLIAFAKNTETDPIRRGKWIRQRLLADTIPDIPITVDAVVPEDPHKTLRQRMEAKTGDPYCWTCHQKMEPLGLPFEVFDDFGRFRTRESLEYPENLVTKVKDKGEPHEDLRDIYQTLPIDSRGSLNGTGVPELDGDVNDAFELIERLAKSDRVRQSIIRHAFRYFMGRNEMLSDSKTLIDADRAYLDSGGSFDALIVSLLTSDSFIYRKALVEKE